jgi:malate dehydrogenase (oxaloacetate-decarboxylating)(NADP+)
VLRAVQVVVDEGLADPDRPPGRDREAHRARRPAPEAGEDFELVNPEDDPRFREYWEAYHKLMGREGVSPEAAKAAVRRSNTLIAA